ncbi:MAG: OmpA family protein [Saprospiraceae bacterium]
MKNILSFFFLFLFASTAFSQQDNYSWRVGATGGAMTYYGDLSTQIVNIQAPWLDLTNHLDHASYGINIENNFSPAWGWRLSVNQGRFQANDRGINWAGEVQQTSEAYRSLNVQTDISNAFFSFNYYTDNGVLFSSKARISPYFNFGIGITHFTPYADLLDANDQRYYYWSDFTIRDSPEMTVPPNGGNIIEQDGNFETNLRDIQTEGVEYNTTTLSFPVGVGLKFRVSDRMNINLEAQAVYTLTDYLDDVSGEYITNSTDNFQNYASNPSNSSDAFRGNPDGLKDIYSYVSLGVYYNFGYKTKSFLPPVFFSKDASLDKKTNGKVDTTVTIVRTKVLQNDGLKIIEDEDILVNTPNTIQKVAEEEVEEIEKEIVQNPVVVEKTITVDSIQKAINFPTMKEPTLTLDTINAADMKGMVIKVDDVEIEKAPKTVQLPKAKTDTVFIKTPVPTSTKLLAEVETSRLELAQLQQKYNAAITQNKQDKTEIVALRSQLDSMQIFFKNYEQYNNSIAVQANDEFSKPENQAIAAATQEMAKEMAYLKTQLDLSNSNYKKAYENAQANQKESEAKIKALEIKVEKLKEKAKKAKRPKRNPLTIINSSRVEKKEKEQKDEKIIETEKVELAPISIDTPNIDVSVPILKDTIATIIPVKKEEVKVIEDVTVKNSTKTIINDNVSKQIIEAKVDSIAKALEQRQIATLAEKKAEVNELNERLAILEKQLQSVKKEENNSEKALQQQLDALAKELSELKNKPAKPTPKVVTVPSPKPIDVKEVIKGYETTNVYFNVGKSTVGIEYENKLQKIASLMLLHPELNAVITGYTDKSGNPTVNLKLSKKRANNVKNYLMQQGIQSNRLLTDFQGSNKATKANDPFARRVEIVLVPSF